MLCYVNSLSLQFVLCIFTTHYVAFSWAACRRSAMQLNAAVVDVVVCWTDAVLSVR